LGDGREETGVVRRLAGILFLVALVALVEGLSGGVLWMRIGHRPRYAELQALRAQVIQASGPAIEVPKPNSENPMANPSLDAVSEILHPYVGFVYNRDLGLHWTYAVNELGFAGPPGLPKREARRVIIGVVGGSVAHEFGQDVFPIVGRRLTESEPYRDREPVYVVLAAGGYKQPQQLMAVTYFLAAGGELDVLINIDGFNEVTLHPMEDRPKGVSPLFPRGWYHRVTGVRDPSVVRTVGELALLEEERKVRARRFSAGPLPLSMTANLWWYLTDNGAMGSIAAVRERLQRAPATTASFLTTGPGIRAMDDDAMYRELAGLWEHSSRLLHRLCRANDIAYFHFLQPNQYDQGSKPMGADERKIALLEDHPYGVSVPRGYPLLSEAGARLRDEGVQFFDLRRMFASFPEQATSTIAATCPAARASSWPLRSPTRSWPRRHPRRRRLRTSASGCR
jgi:hypothetical protein